MKGVEPLVEGMRKPRSVPEDDPEPLQIACADGVRLGGHLWHGQGTLGVVVINAATGVLARYYHRYAAFLASAGFDAITYDYRGIGESRPQSLKGFACRWRDWGTQDFAAVLDMAEHRAGGRPVMVVGHSIGGFLPGLAPRLDRCSAILTVGAQYAYWRDYAPSARLRHLAKWHIAMPALTAILGYFPGSRLGWLEDLPAGVAYEWAFRRARAEHSFPAAERPEMLRRLSTFRGPLLGVTASDDPYGTPAAIARTLAYYTGASRSRLLLSPADLGVERIGHFDLFHARHKNGFWRATAGWLESGGRCWVLGSPEAGRQGRWSSRLEPFFNSGAQAGE